MVNCERGIINQVGSSFRHVVQSCGHTDCIGGTRLVLCLIVSHILFLKLACFFTYVIKLRKERLESKNCYSFLKRGFRIHCSTNVIFMVSYQIEVTSFSFSWGWGDRKALREQLNSCQIAIKSTCKPPRSFAIYDAKNPDFTQSLLKAPFFVFFSFWWDVGAGGDGVKGGRTTKETLRKTIDDFFKYLKWPNYANTLVWRWGRGVERRRATRQGILRIPKIIDALLIYFLIWGVHFWSMYMSTMLEFDCKLYCTNTASWLCHVSFSNGIALFYQNTDQKHVSSFDQDQSSMLKVICNQRDRFRTRLRETEEVRYLYLLYIAFNVFNIFAGI